MANTRDTMGEQTCLDALIADTITEFEDDEVYELRNHVFFRSGTIESVSLPSCKKVGSYAFSGCAALTSVELPACTSVGQNAFYGCTSLISIILGHNGVVSKGNDAIPSQFNSGGAGTIYVPASQLAAYQASGSWNTYNLAAITE